MKKFFITAIIIFIAILSAPVFTVSADSGELVDIPIRGNSESGKAYCLYDEKDGEYTLTYVSSRGTKLLYKSEAEFKYNSSISEDGKTVFYSVNNTVYKYSYESGKRKKIYTAQSTKSSSLSLVYLMSSPNGEYCFIFVEHISGYTENDMDFVIWHDGKTVSQREKADFETEDGESLFGINNKGEVFYTLNRDIYVLDLDGKRLVEKAPRLSSDEDHEYGGYETWVFRETGTYIIRDLNDIYYGETGGNRYKLSFPGQELYCINGSGFIAYNGEYVARYDIKRGTGRNILKLSPEGYEEKRHDFIAVSDDLDKIVYINYRTKKLVRLSGWSDEKNRYTKRQEVMLNGTGKERISNFSDDMSIVLIGNADEERNYYQADFNAGSFMPCEYWKYEEDRFGHKIITGGRTVRISETDGRMTAAFEGVGASCEPWFSNGFYCFYSGGPDTVCNYEGKYDLTYYYIDENGKAVKWYEEKSVYMECHEIEDWDSWEE